MTAVPAEQHAGYEGQVPSGWAEVHADAPQLAATMLTYLDQVGVSLRPTSVRSIDGDLRVFARFVTDHDPALDCVADIDRHHIEAFKIWQQPTVHDGTTTPRPGHRFR